MARPRACPVRGAHAVWRQDTDFFVARSVVDQSQQPACRGDLGGVLAARGLAPGPVFGDLAGGLGWIASTTAQRASLLSCLVT